MKKYRISYILVFLMTGTLFMHNPNAIYTAVFLTVIFFPALSGAAFYLSKMKVEKAESDVTTKEGPVTELYCKEEAVLTVKVKGTPALWAGRMEAELNVHNLFTGEEKIRSVSLFAEKNGFVGTMEICPESCGCLEISLCSLKALDLTGIWVRRLSLHTLSFPVKTCVYVFPIAGLRVDFTRKSSEIFRKSMPFGRKTTGEISGYREYMPGDPMNRIHWKLSAKTGKILLKTFDRRPEKEVLLLLDFRGKKDLTADEKNEMVGNLLETSRRLPSQRQMHWIGCISKGRIRKFPVIDVKSQKAAFLKLLRVTADLEGAAVGSSIRKDWKYGENVIYLFTEKQKTKTGG